MVVRKESAIHPLHDLSGKTLAFPAPAAFAASVLPRANLANNDIPFTAKYVSSHVRISHRCKRLVCCRWRHSAHIQQRRSSSQRTTAGTLDQ